MFLRELRLIGPCLYLSVCVSVCPFVCDLAVVVVMGGGGLSDLRTFFAHATVSVRAKVYAFSLSHARCVEDVCTVVFQPSTVRQEMFGSFYDFSFAVQLLSSVRTLLRSGDNAVTSCRTIAAGNNNRLPLPCTHEPDTVFLRPLVTKRFFYCCCA